MTHQIISCIVPELIPDTNDHSDYMLHRSCTFMRILTLKWYFALPLHFNSRLLKLILHSRSVFSCMTPFIRPILLSENPWSDYTSHDPCSFSAQLSAKNFNVHETWAGQCHSHHYISVKHRLVGPYEIDITGLLSKSKCVPISVLVHTLPVTVSERAERLWQGTVAANNSHT